MPQMDSNWSSQIGEVVAPINLTGTNGAKAQPRTERHWIKDRSPHEVGFSGRNLPRSRQESVVAVFPRFAAACSATFKLK
jgi:hypothetical protein